MTIPLVKLLNCLEEAGDSARLALTFRGHCHLLSDETATVSGITTDSRDYASGELFVALPGEKFDGAAYVDLVLQRGARWVAVEDTPLNQERFSQWRSLAPETTFLFVQSTLQLYQRLAHHYAQIWLNADPDRRLIGITGSNGKTTHKDMLFALLNGVLPGQVLATQKNYNNHIGVPKTLFGLCAHHKIGIVEMGTNHPGEIAVLCEIARPNAGIITNIGDAHLEFLGSRQGVFEEKRVLYDAVMTNTNREGLFLINGDDHWLAQLPAEKNCLVWGSTSTSASISSLQLDYQGDQRLIGRGEREFQLENSYLIGRHNFLNLGSLLGFVGRMIPDQWELFLQSAQTFHQLTGNRSRLVTCHSKRYYLDAYNANPSSMEVSLEGFMQYARELGVPLERQLYIIGDMNELGAHASVLHQQIGALLGAQGGVNCVFIGRYARDYHQGFLAAKSEAVERNSCQRFTLILDDKSEFLAHYWDDIRQRFDIFFIKGSRTLALETLVPSDLEGKI